MHSSFRRSRLFAFLLFVLATGILHAQATSAQPANGRRALLWKVSSPTATVYLLGSIHIVEKDMYPLAQPVEDAFRTSKVLAVEVNMNKFSKEQLGAMAQQRAVYTDGSTLSRHISKTTSDLVDAFCVANELPRAAVEPMKPWMVAMLATLLPLQKAGIVENDGIDMHFLKAIAPQQRIEELETPEFQFDLLASGTDAEQEEMLAGALQKSDQMPGYLRQMQSAFLNGDAAALEKLIEETATGAREYRKRLLDDRNIPMAARVEQYLKGNEQTFVVVGAAHLVGEQGVVSLLRARNYKVEQMLTAD